MRGFPKTVPMTGSATKEIYFTGMSKRRNLTLGWLRSAQVRDQTGRVEITVQGITSKNA